MATDATEVFRFMDLPPEIRDQIYEIILCAWPPPKQAVDKKKHIISIAGELAYYHRRVDFGIVLANRRLWHDAFSVLMKQNLPIKVSLNAYLGHQLLRSKQVPVVAIASRAVESFNGYVMSHSIQLRMYPISPSMDVLILWRDLDCFCQALAESSIPFRGGKHTITIANPFVNTSTPHYLNPRNQARLLEPYRKQLCGFTSFEVTGNVEPSLAESTMQEVSQYPSYDPEDFLQDILQRNKLGHEYFDKGNNIMAYETWDGAFVKILSLTRSMNRVWQQMKTKAGTNWSYRLAEICFQLSYNRVKSIVRVMGQLKEEKALMEHVDRYFHSLESALIYEPFLFRQLGASWNPTATQKAERCYQAAIGHRLVERNIENAERYINFAAQILPANPDIQQERENIARWRAEWKYYLTR
ncbi:hypothetical protein GGR51DRAFT_552923 [Nemania sp. FL0031]|nr:hypothetical protein GGR51DRAFT_552923 [Nemania sp. FL0031]